MSRHHRVFLLSILAAIPGCADEGTACMPVGPGVLECPAPEDVDKDELDGACGSRVRRILGEGDRIDNINDWAMTEEEYVPGCCYPVKQTRSTCEYGRPLRVEEAAVVAAGDGLSDWSEALVVESASFTPAIRAELVLRWTRAALDEHASVAAFSRVALDLLRHDAPAELIEAAHRAALDEVRHARRGFAIASAIAGEPVRPGVFPLGHSLPLAEDLAAVAVEAARDGCIGETVAALLARAAASRCEDPAIRAVLLGIAEDEEKHAILGWRTVAWAIGRGGAAVREAVAAVFRDAAREGVAVPLVGEVDAPELLARVGLLNREASRAEAARALRLVILPAAERVLTVGARRGSAEVSALA